MSIFNFVLFLFKEKEYSEYLMSNVMFLGHLTATHSLNRANSNWSWFGKECLGEKYVRDQCLFLFLTAVQVKIK